MSFKKFDKIFCKIIANSSIILFILGISLIFLAFMVDWIGFSQPGWSSKQTRLLIDGIMVLVLGGIIWRLKGLISSNNLKSLFMFITIGVGIIITWNLMFSIIFHLTGIANLTFRGLIVDIFGASEKIIIATILLGFFLLITNNRLEQLQQKALAIWKSGIESIRSLPLRDIIVAVILYVVGMTVGIVYAYKIQQSGTGVFYIPTVGVVSPPYWWYGNLLGMVVALTYGIYRLGMGRLLAMFFSLMLVISPMQLYILMSSPNRDYARAPALLAIIFIIGLMVVLPFERRRLLALSTAAGIAIGAGLWFRPEANLYILFFTVTLFFFLSGGVKSNLKIKITALLLLLAVQFLLSPPTPEGIQSLSMTAGFMSPMDSQLGITRPAYDWGYLLLDEHILANTLIQSKEIGLLSKFSAGYEFLVKYLIYCPADLLARIYGAMIKILSLPFSYILPPMGINNPLLIGLYSMRATLSNYLAPITSIITVTALLLIAYYSVRKAIFCLILLYFVASYTIVQFFGRNYFYLEFMGWWALGFVLQQIISLLLYANKRHSKVEGQIAFPGDN